MDSSEVLPSTLRYTSPPTLPQAREYSFTQRATEDYYDVSLKPTIQIDIPRLQRSYLEKTSRLEFTVSAQIKEGTGLQPGQDFICLDTPGAYSFIDTIEVYDYLGSTLLERIDGVAQLMALVMDTVSTDHPLSYTNETALGTVRGNVLEGRLFYESVGQYSSQIATDGGTLAGQNIRSLSKTLDQLDGPTSGAVLNVRNAAGSTVGSTTIYTYSAEFSLPLYSFLGLLSEKLVPLHNGFTLMVTLNTAQQSLGCASPGGMGTSISHTSLMSDVILTNVSFKMDILELGPTAENLVISANGEGPLTIHTKALRHYEKTLDGSVASGTDPSVPASSLTINWPINLNASSVTSVLWFMRPQKTQNSYSQRSLSQRIRNNLSSWSLKYGSSTLPRSSGITCSANNTPSGLSATNAYSSSGSDCLVHLLKARGISTSPVISSRSFNHNGYSAKLTFTAYNAGASSVSSTVTQMDDLLNALVPGGTAFAAYVNTMNSTAAGNVTFNQIQPYYHIPPVGRFACGLSTALINSDSTVSGLNTNGMSTAIEATFIPPPSASIKTPTTDIEKFQYAYNTGSMDILPSIVDIYMEYDAFISILPNISTNVSF